MVATKTYTLRPRTTLKPTTEAQKRPLLTKKVVVKKAPAAKQTKKIDIHEAIRKGNLRAVKRAIANGQDLEEPEDVKKFVPDNDSDWDDYNDRCSEDTTMKVPYTPLGLAIMHKQTQIALTLIEKGADLDSNPEYLEQYAPNSYTPLGAAVVTRNYKVMKALLAAGAKPDEPCWCYFFGTYDYDNQIEYTPLMIAIIKKDSAAIEILLAGGANKEWTHRDGYCVKDVAACPDNFTRHIFTRVLKFDNGCTYTESCRCEEFGASSCWRGCAERGHVSSEVRAVIARGIGLPAGGGIGDPVGIGDPGDPVGIGTKS